MTVDCLAPVSTLDIGSLLGQEITVGLRTAEGNWRLWHAIVEGADALGADGGLARYRLHAAPWLAALDLRRDNFIFQDKSIEDIVSEVFADYEVSAFRFDLTHPLPLRTRTTQYQEADLAFVSRLLAEAGLSYRFEHEQSGLDDDGQPGTAARHTFVMFDSDAPRPRAAASALRFHRGDATETADSITRFVAARSVQSRSVARSGWDEQALVAHAAQASSDQDDGDVPDLEDYDYGGHRRYADGDAADQATALQLQSHRSNVVRMEGAGMARALQPGAVFELSQHDRFSAGGADADDIGTQRYTVLGVLHEAANNLDSEAKRVLDHQSVDRGSYRNSFDAQPDAAPLVPPWQPRPTAPESVCAVVVAADEAAITTGRDLRIKVQFPWQRGQKPLAGGLPHSSTGDDVGNAPGNDRSGSWLRVATGQAGPNWGMQNLPRSGTEVVVTFLDGDIDQPIVAAQLYSDGDLPPFAAGEDGDAGHDGVLSGWHSNNLEGRDFTQWVTDDTQGQLRMRLAASAAASQLGMGYIVEQQAEQAKRGEWRGTGFELRSDAWTVVRGGRGILLSATARSQAESTQLDAKEALGMLRGAQGASQRLDSAAVAAQASSLVATTGFDGLIQSFDPAAKGKHVGAVGGQAATRPSGSSRSGGAPVERIDGARILIDAPNSLNLATPATAVQHAGENLHSTVQSDAHVAAMQTFSGVAGASASVYAQDGGLTAIAADAPVSIHAHAGELTLHAAEGMKIMSTTAGIDILAQKDVTLQAGGASVTLAGGDIVFRGPGLFSVKGSAHSIVGAASDAAQIPGLPRTQVGDAMIMTAELVTSDAPAVVQTVAARAGMAAGAVGAGTAGGASASGAGIGLGAASGAGGFAKNAFAGTPSLMDAPAGAGGFSGVATNAMGVARGAMQSAGQMATHATSLVSGMANTVTGAVGQVQAAVAQQASGLMSGVSSTVAAERDSLAEQVSGLFGSPAQAAGTGATASAAGLTSAAAQAAGQNTGQLVGQMAGQAGSMAAGLPSAAALPLPGGLPGMSATPGASVVPGVSTIIGLNDRPGLSGVFSGMQVPGVPDLSAAVTHATAAAANGAITGSMAQATAGVAGTMGNVTAAASLPAAAAGAVSTAASGISGSTGGASSAIAQVSSSLAGASGIAGVIGNLPKMSNLPGIVDALPGLSGIPGLEHLNRLAGIADVLKGPGMADLGGILDRIPGMPDLANVPGVGKVLGSPGMPGIFGRAAGDGTGAPLPAEDGRIRSYYAATRGAHLQYVNFPTAEERWKDEEVLRSLDRQTDKPKVRVKFSSAKAHPFTVTVKPDPRNLPYSSTEKSRHPKYVEPQATRKFSYTTNLDGTYVVDDIMVPAGGLNVYTFEVRDSNDQLIMTETIETVRRFYIQEIVLPGTRANTPVGNIRPAITEFARHGVDVVQLPRVTGPVTGNVDFNGASEAQFKATARACYANSAGAAREPFVLAICHVESLAVRDHYAQPLIMNSVAGPNEAATMIPLSNGQGGYYHLWLGIDNRPWYIEASFKYEDAEGNVVSIPLPENDRVRPMPADQAKPNIAQHVVVRMNNLTPTRIEGEIHIKVHMMTESAAGLAWNNGNLIAVAARNPFELNDEAYQLETLVHEIGHQVGMSPSGPNWSASPNGDATHDLTKLDKVTHYYALWGNHCHFGQPVMPVEQYVYHVGDCVMYGADTTSIRFCPACARAAKKADMSFGWTRF